MPYFNYSEIRTPIELWGYVHFYRRQCFGTNRLADAAELRAAREAALRMCAENPSLPPVPVTRNDEDVTLASKRDDLIVGMVSEQDFIELEEWCLMADDCGNSPNQGAVRWSRIMPLTRISERLLKDSRKWQECRTLYAHRLEQIGGKSSKDWRIRLDGLDEDIQKLFDRP